MRAVELQLDPTTGVPLKRCSRCGEAKPLSEFHSSRKSTVGKESRCKVCRAIQARDYGARPEVKEAAAERARKRRAEHRRQHPLPQRTWRSLHPNYVEKWK